MHILITGGSGFIGSYVTNSCIDKGHTILLHTRTTSKPRRVTRHEGVKYLCIDLLDIRDSHLTDVECIIHLAAAGISPRMASWRELENVNIKGTLHICQLAKEIDASVIIAGSFAEYGLSALRYDKIPVNAPLEPTDPYAASKAAAGQLAMGFARSEGLRMAYLRIFNAFGEGQNEVNLWPSLKKAAISGNNFAITPGEQIRDFIHVSEVGSLFEKALTSTRLEKGVPLVKNIASGNPTSIFEFCRHWWEKLGAKGELEIGKIPYRVNEIMRYVPEIDTEFINGQ